MCSWQICTVATPLWPSVGVKPNTPKVGDLESSGTPECLEFDSKAQNTSHWGVLGVIGKVLKRRYRKWPRIGHLDICSPSYAAKEGPGVKLPVWLPTTKSRESTRSRRALVECDTSLERSQRGIQYWFRPRPDPRSGRGVMAVQSPESPIGTHLGQLRDSISGVPGKSDIRMPLPRSNAEYTIGSKVVAYSRVRPVVSLVCPSARGKSQHPRVSRMLN
jgi:hypothetical protein